MSKQGAPSLEQAKIRDACPIREHLSSREGMEVLWGKGWNSLLQYQT